VPFSINALMISSRGFRTFKEKRGCIIQSCDVLFFMLLIAFMKSDSNMNMMIILCVNMKCL
jgi:hypothetical protein